MVVGRGDERIAAKRHSLDSARATTGWATEITGRRTKLGAADLRKPQGRLDRAAEVNDTFSIWARHAWVWENSPSGL